jgi:hypothetical protein
MNTREQIQQISKEIETLYEASGGLQKLAWDKTQAREILISQCITEEKLLQDTNWELDLGGGSATYLTYSGITPGTTMETILDMARHDWHSRFTVQEGISFHFDDSEISLHFVESKMILPFAQKHGMIIDGSGVQNQLARLKRDAAALELICHQFSL